MKPIPWKELAEMIHANNVAKGWWDEPRTWRKCRVLIVSEISEALEEFRSGSMELRTAFRAGSPGKPEGFPSEVADGAIRILDWLEHHGHDVGARFFPITVDETGVPEQLDWITECLYTVDPDGDSDQSAEQCLDALRAIVAVADERGIDLEAMIRLKHAYNVTRPRMHGGKKC